MANEKHYISRNSVIPFTAFLFFCLLSVFQLVHSFSVGVNATQESVATQHDDISVSADRSTAPPAFPFSTPFEAPGKNELESLDECDDEIGKFLSIVSAKSSELLHSKKRQFFQLILSVKNRSSVSLVVLHHCWKIFS